MAQNLLSGVVTRIQFQGDRTAQLVQNLAHISTPGYKAKDVTAPSNLQDGFKVTLAQTSSNHIRPQQTASAGQIVTMKADIKPNGNSVNEHTQLALLAASHQESTFNMAVLGKIFKLEEALLR